MRNSSEILHSPKEGEKALFSYFLSISIGYGSHPASRQSGTRFVFLLSEATPSEPKPIERREDNADDQEIPEGRRRCERD